MTNLAQESNVKYTKTNYQKGKAEEKFLNNIGTTENNIKTLFDSLGKFRFRS